MERLTIGDVMTKKCPNGHGYCLSARCWNQDIGKSKTKLTHKKGENWSETDNSEDTAKLLINCIGKGKEKLHFYANLNRNDVLTNDEIIYINHSNKLVILKVFPAIKKENIEGSIKIRYTEKLNGIDFNYGILSVSNKIILDKIIQKVQNHINTQL